MAGGRERVLRRRISSVQNTKKITRAMELIAATRVVKAQQRARAAPSGHDLVGDEQRSMRGADRLHLRKHRGRIHQHAPRPQHQRLDDECRRACSAFCLQRVKCGLRVLGGKGHAADIEQHGGIGGIEHAARADRHRADRVAVIGMLHHHHAAARLATMRPVTERHLERDLDRGRPAVGEEHAGERIGQDAAQFMRHVFRGLVRPAGEDHLVEPLRLVGDRRHDARGERGHHRVQRGGVERRAAHRAGQDNAGHASLAQGVEERAEVFHTVALDAGFRQGDLCPREGDAERVRVRRGEGCGQRAAPGDDA